MTLLTRLTLWRGGSVPRTQAAVPTPHRSVPSAPESVPAAPGHGRPKVPVARFQPRVERGKEVAVPEAPGAVPTTAPGVPGTSDAVSGAARRGLNVFAVIGGLVLAGIGFTGSYRSLVKLGEAHHFGEFAQVFPVGVDVGIVVLYALDLVLTHRRIRWPILRLAAHGFTVATIVFNAASGGRPLSADPVGVGMHAVIPVMFVTAVEAARRVIIQVTRAEDVAAGTRRDGIPLERWILDPAGSFSLHRRMVLLGIRSYDEAVDRRRDQLIYRAALDRIYPKGKQYPKGWKSAPMEARLPMIMAPYGLTVDEALAIPEQARAAEQQREREQEERQEQEALAAQIRTADARILLLAKQAEVAEAEEGLDARKSVASVAARSAYAKATAVAEAEERVAVQEAEALESATAAAAQLQAAEDRLAAATKAQQAEQLEAAAAADRHMAALADEETAVALAETERLEVEAARREKEAADARAAALGTRQRALGTEQQLAAEQRQAADQSVENSRRLEAAAEMERRAAGTRAAAAETDRRAVEAELANAEARRRRAKISEEAALAERRAAEEAAAAETVRLDAVGMRRRVAEAEALAVEMEDHARLTPRERDARRVARMILTDGAGDPDAIQLDVIAGALGVSVSTASERRKEAADLIAGGYTLPRPELAVPCPT
ncbi:DUF2637 domain-containing protein [Streptomyces prunicolor]|uniref:DUF2637 domain-containing protein n=1 Tax=Streptomyces prunicolor TaxID=67348 RepID=UPI000998AB40|nr:DUF2637 domain-containing protein [Streptomyces prunicolor]